MSESSGYNGATKSTEKNPVKWDLRSDTVTKPTPEMLKVMMAAETGDDVFGEDPSISRFEKRVAELFGKEDGLFCASGTLSNQLGIRSHLKVPPYSVVCDANAHVYVHEAGGIAYHSLALTVPVEPLANKRYITLEEIKKKIFLDNGDFHIAPTRLICLENTINGMVFPIEEIRKISAYAREHNIGMHMDGARIWNASIASGTPFTEYGKCFDSISICFSKGMGAPVGSVLVGSKEFIANARKFRKLFGAGWRQAGILAEAANYTIDNHLPLLQNDHKRAKCLADQLSQLGIKFLFPVETSILFVDFSSTGINAHHVAEALKEAGVLVIAFSEVALRIVFHHQVQEGAVEAVVEVIKKLLQA
ncbi:Low specificity L-threonine aldolase [Zancudomyces culisetae]|uniref:Low specificity L-threonine aldolase n=1 Tax=Zancudomyces culisetae TaxID=1213189 RepID=A0A1R1PYD4_ZANCU|nr:Low specificity L-threonine aldolase [Zancudomyces culisetae]|eukprot:OMH85948.1 Low specificity L-threonine aldolase [Zancudomyces culisetae]